MDPYRPGTRASLLWSLVARLPHEPGSMWRAVHSLGGAQWLWWGRAEWQRADMLDAQVLHVRATAQQKASLADHERAARPGGVTQAPTRVVDASDDDAMRAYFSSLG